MKILYYHQHFSTPAGAAGTRSYENAQQLIKRGHQVTMICGSYRGGVSGLTGPFNGGLRRGLVDGIDVVEFELPYSNYDSLFKRATTFLRYALRSIGLSIREEYDLVFATSTPLTAGIPGIFAKVFFRKRFVFEVRDLWPELPRAMGVIKNPFILLAMSILEYFSYHAADACIALSPGIKQGIAERGKKETAIVTIPNGCDIDLFAPEHAIPWQPEGITDEDFVAVFTGAHGVANGLDAVLDMAKILDEKGLRNIKIVFVGDGKCKPSLLQRCKNENITNCIFIDPVAKHRLSGLLARADVGLMVLQNIPAFYFGTSPNKFFDYISASLPVINNYPGWLSEMIMENNCGLAVVPDDSAKFAEAVEQLAGLPKDELAIMGMKARNLAAQKFDRKHLAACFAKYLEQVC